MKIDPFDPFWKIKLAEDLSNDNPIGCLIVGILIAIFVGTILFFS